MESADFWNNQKQAQKTVADLKALRARFEPLKSVIADFEDAKVAYEMGKEGDKDLLREADAKLYTLYGKPVENITGRMDKIELQSLLSGRYLKPPWLLPAAAALAGRPVDAVVAPASAPLRPSWRELGTPMPQYIVFSSSIGTQARSCTTRPSVPVGIIV